MIWLHLLLLSGASLLSAQNVITRTSHIRSGDLPEDYHMATASSGTVSNETLVKNGTSSKEVTTEPTEFTTENLTTGETSKGSEDGMTLLEAVTEPADELNENNSTKLSVVGDVTAEGVDSEVKVTTIDAESVTENPVSNTESNDILSVSPSFAGEKEVSESLEKAENVNSTEIVAKENVTESRSSLLNSVPESHTESTLSEEMTLLPSSPVGRSFTMELESQEDVMERRSDDDATTKPYKNKKKILASRPKTSTEKLVLETDLEGNSTEKAEPRSFYSFSTSTTETADATHTTSAFIISEKVVNDNLLNVVDTAVRPVVEDKSGDLLHRAVTGGRHLDIGSSSARPHSPSRNTIRFGDDFAPTGQSDWVPLVSEQVTGPDWPKFVPSSTTEWGKISSTEPTRRRKTTASSRIKFPDDTTERKTPGNDTEQLDVATWTLAMSQMTRKPVNGSVSLEQVAMVTPSNNTLYKVLKEKFQNAYNRATERYTAVTNHTTEPSFSPPIREEAVTESAANGTKDELNNTIPDTIVDGVRTTRRPVTPPFTKSDAPNDTVSDVTTSSPTTRKWHDVTMLTDIDAIEHTIAYESMKTTPKTSTTEKIFVNIVDDDDGKYSPTYTTTSSSSTADKRVMFDTSTTSTTSTTTTESLPMTTEEVMTTQRILTEMTPFMQNLLDRLAQNTTTEQAEVKFEEITEEAKETPTIPPEVEALPTEKAVPEELVTEAVVPTEKPIVHEDQTEKPEEITAPPWSTEKTDDENRTILNNTVLERPLDEVTEETVSAYLRLTVEASQIELCHRQHDLRAAILKILSEGASLEPSIEARGHCLVILNLSPSICKIVRAANRSEDALVAHRHVNMFLRDEYGEFNKNLSEVFLRVWGENGLDFPLPILKVDLVTPLPDGELEPMMGGGVVAAIVISVIAGLCLILLGMLFVIMKRRQKKFNYGQRCVPVSLDAYSLDSVSIRNSSRRKGGRASKRSYGNPAFDDPDIPTNLLNFAGLANFALEKRQLHEELANIPQVAPRPDELPSGVEAKNRYANVIPLPETRVMLNKREGDVHSEYINANFVKGLNSSSNLYIAAQAPLEVTLADWWRLIWEQQVKVILMLTALQENGVEKCADYLPPNEVTDSLRLFGDFHVVLKKREVKDKYIISTLQLKNLEKNLVREVVHLWYIGWPDNGVPGDSNSLIAFLLEARSQSKATSAPTLVHCSPGTGRTGTVIACDMLLREYELKRQVDIPRCVYHLRRCRAGAVQTKDQYAFIYQVVNAYATKLANGGLDLA